MHGYLTDDPGLTISSNCTGYGGLDIAVQRVFGGRVVSYSDIEPGPIALMAHRHPGLPNLGDIKQINPYRAEYADIWTGGYPCQPFSNAGKRLGTDDERHIWPWIAGILGATRPRIVVLENVAAHLRRGFDVVSADLANLGYLFAWTVVPASAVGAPHQRKRLFIVAVTEDAHGELGQRQRERSAPGQTEGGRSRPDAGRRGVVPVAESQGVGWSPWWDGSARAQATQPESVFGGDALADADSARLQVGHGRDGDELATAKRSGDAARWGKYAAAITRWESVRGLTAPDPTVTGARGGQVLSPLFVEWMMGLDPGHVTSVPGLSRNQMLKLLGNGVVPQQAEYAIRGLWARLMGVG